jgi:dipeptidyl aminopeptidase/acylaminoacyl peptidase
MKASRNRIITAGVIAALVLAIPASGHSDQPTEGEQLKVVYTRMVGRTMYEPESYLDRDLFYQSLPGGKPIRLTEWAKHPLLGPGIAPVDWSPDGSRILVFGVSKKDKPVPGTGDQPSYPWILDVKTGQMKVVGQTKDRWYLNAKWLPDGRAIVARVVLGKKPEFYYYSDLQEEFVMSRDETRLVWIDLKTGREKVIKRNLAPGLFFVSPKGRRVIMYDRWSDWFTLFDLDSGKQRRLCKSYDGLDTAAISPDGRKLAFYHNSVLGVCDIATRKTRVLLKGRYSHMHGRDLLWSPNAQRLALEHTVTDVGEMPTPEPDVSSWLVLIDSRTGRSRVLLEDTRGVPVGWTRDGASLVLERSEKTDLPYPLAGKQVITVYPVSGHARRWTVDVPGELNYLRIY